MVKDTFVESLHDARMRYRRLSRYLSQFLHYAVRERRSDAHQLALIATSSHFDSNYYRSRYEDVAEAGVDPVMHYVDFGAHEHRNPSADFNTAQYLNQHPVIANENVNPLLHYLRNGSSGTSAVAHMAPRVPTGLATKPKPMPAPERPADTAISKETPPRLSAIISYFKSLDDDALVSALQRIETSVVVPRARDHFKGKAWQKLRKLSLLLLNKRADHQRLLLVFGRGNLYAGNEEGASHLLSVAARLFPESAEAHLYCGVAHLRARSFGPAIASFRSALKLDPANINVKRELGTALRLASRTAQVTAESQVMAGEAAALLVEVYRAQSTPAAALAAARMLYEQRRYDECNALLDEVANGDTAHVEHLLLKSKALVGLNRIEEALSVSERILALEPGNQAAGLLLRTCRFLAGDDDSGAQTFGQVVFGAGVVQCKGIHPDDGEFTTIASDGKLEEVVARLPYEWLQVSRQPEQLVLEPGKEFIQRLANQIDPRAGFQAHGDIKFWRRNALVDLARSGLLQNEPTELMRLESIHASVPRPISRGATAIVMSRNGSFKFGGGEHLLESMAEHYRSLGYDPMIVGTRPEFRGQTGEVNGIRFAFVDDDTASLRRFFVEQDAHLVHAISGLGYRVAEALAYTNIPFIYGVHYWREVLGQEDEGFFDDDGEPIPRPEFHYILSRATTVYANSTFTRDVIEKAFGVRCPVVYSVPREAELAS